MIRLLRDVRQAVRGLHRRPSLTVFAVLTFALGIGITTAVFSLFYGALLRPLPYANPDELVMVYDVQPACATCPASFTKFDDWRTNSSSFAVLAGSSTLQVVVTGLGDAMRVPACLATWTLSDLFGVRPIRGRWFSEAEDTPGGPKVAVVSHAFWTTHLGARADVVGMKVSIDGQPREIVGVMPAGFYHRGAEVFLPVARAADPAQRGNHFLATYGRLKPGVTVEQARGEMRAVGERLMKEFGHNHGIDVQWYPEVVTGSVAEPLRVLMSGVSLVLLVACANVANLLLASGLARRRELAVRAAIGATRGDLARQIVVESLVLAVVGGAAGLLLARWTTSAFVALSGGVLPRAVSFGIDGGVVAFAVAVSMSTGVLCGLWPVVRLSRRSIGGDMREGDVRSGSASGGRRFGGGLVVAEVAIAFCLLVGAGLVTRNLLALEARETGFEAEGRVAFDLAPTGPRYADATVRLTLFQDLQARLSALPGVDAVGSTSHLPMYQYGWNGEVSLEGGNPWPDGEAPLVEFRWVGGDYFEAMGIALEAGRLFEPTDRDGSTRVTVISARAAEKFWPGESPLGRRFSRGGPTNPRYEVIGVVDDVRSFGLERPSPFEMYMPIAQDAFLWQTFVLRTKSGDPALVIPQVRAIVRDVDPDLPVARVQTLEDVVAGSVTQPRLISALASLFGALAAVLAAVGVYGVMAYNVRRERREYGIRLALGADPARVRRLVATRGLVLGSVGVTIGVVLAVLATRFMRSILAEQPTTDPLVYAAAGFGLVALTVAAAWMPARLASRIDPIIVLRAE